VFFRILSFLNLIQYAFLKNYYTKKDGYYIKFSSKYHQISKKFTIYYLENSKNVCCFDGTIENKVFKLDLDNIRPFGKDSVSLIRNLDFFQIKERVCLFLDRYYPDIVYK
jgi:hypothetical protein